MVRAPGIRHSWGRLDREACTCSVLKPGMERAVLPGIAGTFSGPYDVAIFISALCGRIAEIVLCVWTI